MMSQRSSTESALVTGANGFVGLNLVHQLIRRGIPVVAAGRRPPDTDLDLARFPNVEWVICDVTQREDLIALVRDRAITRIVHAAAVTPTPEVERNDPARVVDVNLVGTLNALEAARQSEVQRFVFVSSSALYRGVPATSGPVRERDALPPPDNLYSLCKDAGERLCRQYGTLCNLSVASIRLGTAYGPWERQSMSRTRLSAIAQLVDWGLTRGNQPIRIHGAGIARDYLHVEDACAAIAALTLKPQLRWDLYNLASEVSYPLEEALQALQASLPGFRWHPVAEPRMADFSFGETDARAPLDMSRLRTELPDARFRDLSSGVGDYVAWLDTDNHP